MTQFIFSLAAALIAFWLAHGYVYPALFPSTTGEVSSLSLERTIAEIKRELHEVGQAPGKTAGLVLKEIAVELAAQRESDDGLSGALVVPVFSEASMKSGRSLKTSAGSKISVVFEPPPGQELLESPRAGSLDLSELVLRVREALLSANDDAAGPELTPKSVDIEVSFLLVRTQSSDTNIKAYVVSIGAKSERVESDTNKVTLRYRNPALQHETGKEDDKPIPPR